MLDGRNYISLNNIIKLSDIEDYESRIKEITDEASAKVFEAEHIRVYKIKEIISKDGKNCVCYKAERYMNNGITRIVILKEFYPKYGSTMYERTEEGTLIYNADDSNICESIKRYRESIKAVQNFIQDESNEEILKYMCIDRDYRPLFALSEAINGSVYCENTFYGTDYWLKQKDDEEVSLSQVLQTSTGVMEFLKLLHKNGREIAYVDIKPGDILLRRNENGIINYGEVAFFDFDSNRKFGEYLKSEIMDNVTYPPRYFQDEEEKIKIGRSSENCTFSEVMKIMIEEKKKTEQGEIVGENDKILRRELDEYLAYTKENGMSQRNEGDVCDFLQEKIKEIEKDEIENKAQKEKKMFKLVWKGWLSLLIPLYLAFWTVAYKTLIIVDANDTFYKYMASLMVLFVLIICNIVIISYCAKVYSHAAVSSKYYEKRDSKSRSIRDKDYNAFRIGRNRWRTTFQDHGVLHRAQQRLRYVAWILLLVGIPIGGTVISIKLRILPIFFVVGILMIMVFMWVDYCLAVRRDLKTYYKYAKNTLDVNFSGHDEFVKKYCSARSFLDNPIFKKEIYRKALFYGEEYMDSHSEGRPFDIKGSFYENKDRNVPIRNVGKLKLWILNKFFDEELYDSIPGKWYYDKRISYIEEMRKKSNAVIFTIPLFSKHVYKMAFDRVKNEQLILNFVFFVLTCLGICFVGMHGLGENGMSASYLPESRYVLITMILLIITGIINIFRAFQSVSYESVAEELAYKSNFANVESLDELLSEDIVAGYVQTVDICRGITRYHGSIIGDVYNENPDTRDKRINQYEEARRGRMINNRRVYRPLLHHREYGHRRHLIIMVWCSFLILFSLLVWYMGLYWTFFPLLILAIAIHIVWRQWILPNIGKKKLIKAIEHIIDLSKESDLETK